MGSLSQSFEKNDDFLCLFIVKNVVLRAFYGAFKYVDAGCAYAVTAHRSYLFYAVTVPAKRPCGFRRSDAYCQKFGGDEIHKNFAILCLLFLM